jgi:uncharacterized membrane protein
MYELLMLVGVVLLLAYLVCSILLPIIAIARTRHIGLLKERIARLEDMVRRLREGVARQTPLEPLRPPQALEPIQQPETTAVEALAAYAAGDLGTAAGPTVVEVPAVLPARRPKPLKPSTAAFDAPDLEAWLGRRGLGWVAVLLLLFAGGFFLKYSFENQWIGPLGRVAIGILAGSGLCVAGLHFHRRRLGLFSQMLTAAGVVLIYLATFASFGYYRLLPRDQAVIVLLALVVETFGLALVYDAPAIALMAIVGGLLSPVLLHTGHDQYAALFSYLAVLNAGAVGLALFRAWPWVGSVALLGTQLLFWGWYLEHYHPEKLLPALVFQAVLFSLYLAYGAAAHIVRRRLAGIEDLVRWVLNAFLVGAAFYVLLDEDYHVWMGALALALAAVFAGLGWVIQSRRPEDQRQLLVVVGTALAFVAAAIPLQADAAWIPVGWAIEGLALWWFGHRIGAEALRSLGGVLLFLAFLRLVFVDAPYGGREPFVPLFNRFGLPAAVVAACLVSAAATSRRFLGRLGPADRIALWLTGLAAVGLIWFILSVEAHGYFVAQIGAVGDDYHLRRAGQTALSVVWAVYAAVLLWLGFGMKSDPLRWAALALFGVTLLKVVFVDMADLPGLYRVLAFLALALMMGGAAWGYQRFQLNRRAREESEHAATRP